jgi:hypothetical protein
MAKSVFLLATFGYHRLVKSINCDGEHIEAPVQFAAHLEVDTLQEPWHSLGDILCNFYVVASRTISM